MNSTITNNTINSNTTISNGTTDLTNPFHSSSLEGFFISILVILCIFILWILYIARLNRKREKENESLHNHFEQVRFKADHHDKEEAII